MTTAKTGFIGRSVERLEDPPLVTGRGRFAADISFPGQVHMRIVRSAVAHGEIVGIDVAAARAQGVEVIDWPATERRKIRELAVDIWRDWSTRSPMAGRAYQAQIAFLAKIGLIDR